MMLGMFLVLCVAALAAAKPSTLTGQLRKLRTPVTSCADLSDVFGAMLRHGDDPQRLVIGDVVDKQNFTKGHIDFLRRRIYGFDISNMDRLRELYTCDITAVSTLSQLKAKVDAHDFLYNNLRLVYDFMVLSTPRKNLLPPGNQLRLINALESVGLLGLDPVGVESFGQALYSVSYKNITTDYNPAPPFPGSNENKCNHVTNAVARLIQENLHQGLVDGVKDFTGVDLSSQLDVRSLICAIIDGSAEGLKGAYAGIEDQGVFRQLYKSVYPLLVQYIPMGRELFEDRLESLEEQHMLLLQLYSGSPFDQKAKKSIKTGMDFIKKFMAEDEANNFAKAKRSHQQGRQRYNTGDYGNDAGSETNQDVLDLENQITTLRLTIDFLKDLENIGILSLDDDL